MIALRTAIHGVLSADATLIALLGSGANGVVQGGPKKTTALPYVVIAMQAPSRSRHTFATASVLETHLVRVKAVVKSDDGMEPALVSTIEERINVLLDGASLTLSSGRCLMIRRDTRISYPEPDPNSDTVYFHAGAVYSVMTSKA